MLLLSSPAKDIDVDQVPSYTGATHPRFQQESAPLIAGLRTMSARRLMQLMDSSPRLAELNHQRHAEWELPLTPQNARPAVFTFNGEADRGLDAAKLTADERGDGGALRPWATIPRGSIYDLKGAG